MMLSDDVCQCPPIGRNDTAVGTSIRTMIIHSSRSMRRVRHFPVDAFQRLPLAQNTRIPGFQMEPLGNEARDACQVLPASPGELRDGGSVAMPEVGYERCSGGRGSRGGVGLLLCRK